MFEPSERRWTELSMQDWELAWAGFGGIVLGLALAPGFFFLLLKVRDPNRCAEIVFTIVLVVMFALTLTVVHRWWRTLGGRTQARCGTTCASVVLAFAWMLSAVECRARYTCGCGALFVEAEIVILEAVVDLYTVRHHGQRPGSIRDLVRDGLVKRIHRDPWGQPYRLEYLQHDEIHICSAGGDRLFDTRDDVCSKHPFDASPRAVRLSRVRTVRSDGASTQPVARVVPVLQWSARSDRPG